MVKIHALKLRNFKSFKKADIPVANGLTAVVGANGSGKCLVGDSKIQLANGKVRTIKDIVDTALLKTAETENMDDGIFTLGNPEGIEILSLNPNTAKIEQVPVTAFIKRTAPENLLNIKLRSGKEITTTPYHPLIILKDGKITSAKAEELSVGSKVATPRKLEVNLRRDNLLLNLFGLEDNIYVPYSDKVYSLISDLMKAYGSVVNVSVKVGIPKNVIKGIRDKQAVNIYWLVKILCAIGRENEIVSFVTEIKSKSQNKTVAVPKISADLARYAGYLFAEGGFQNSNQIRIINEDKKIIADFEKLSKKLFGAMAYTKKYKPNCYDSMIFSHAAGVYLENLFGLKQGAHAATKKFSPFVFELTNEEIGHLIGSYFSGDGHVSKNHLELTSASKDIIYAMQTLLLRLGISSTISKTEKCAANTKNKVRRTHYRLSIYGKGNLGLFNENIYLVGKKKETLTQVLESFQNKKTNPNFDVIPGVQPIIRDLFSILRVNSKELSGFGHPKLKAYLEGSCAPSRAGLIEVADIFESKLNEIEKVNENELFLGLDLFLHTFRISQKGFAQYAGVANNISDFIRGARVPNRQTLSKIKLAFSQLMKSNSVLVREKITLLRRLANSEVYWEEIVDIRRIVPKDKYVYDLTVIPYHNFVAENCIVHNSNVIDALMFVFGISSLKTIRADRLSDLVFHKSVDGKARVSVVLKDGEKDYVVTRTIDKQGKSVYRIDGKRTTRSAIHALLMSLNISTSGHNVVLQGDIERVIEMTPRMRRTVIDEVAGIAEYEEKKVESLRQLDKVEDKIKEWHIIKGERQEMLDALKKDKEDAERFQELNTKVKRIKSTVLGSEIQRYEKDFEHNRKLLESSDTKIKEAKEKIEELDAEISTWDKKLKDLNKEILESGGAGQTKLAQDMEKLRTDIELNKEKTKSRKEQISKNTQAIQELRERQSNIESEITQKENELKALEEKNAPELKKLKDLRDKQTELLEKYKQEDESAYEHESQLRKKSIEIDGLKEQFYLLKAAIDAYTREIEIKKEQSQGAEEAIKKAQSRYDAIEEELASYKNELDSVNRSISSYFEEEKRVNKKFETVENELKAIREDYVSLKTTLSTLKSAGLMQPPGVDALIEAKKKSEISGIYGTVADLCKYSDNNAVAIETAIGSKMFYVVVDDDKTATDCINYLKKKNLGRVAFIPLNKIRGRAITAEVKPLAKNAGAIDFAINLVDFRESFRPAFEYIFGDTLVIDKIESARKVGVGKIRMVTEDGDISESSGVMLGGSRNKKTLTIKDVKRVKELEQQVMDVEAMKRNALSDIERVRIESNELREKRAEIEGKIKEVEKERNILSEQLGDTQKGLLVSVKDIESHVKLKKKESEKLLTKISQLETEKKEIETLVAKSRASKSRLEIDDLSKQIDALKESMSTQTVGVQRLKTEIEQGLEIRKKETVAQIENISKETDSFDNEIKVSNNSITILSKELEKKEIELRKTSKSLETLLERKDAVDKKLEELGMSKGKHLGRISGIESSVNEARINMAKVETKLADLKEEFKQYVGVEPLKDSVSDLMRQLPELEAKIEALGAVNMRALTLYDEYLQKINEIEEKIDILRREREVVLDMISKIDSKREKAFRETFDSIRVNFETVYPQLTEGKGTLKIDNEEDLFNSGLLIEAAPKGRAMLRNIDALSGGEKTLTSLAFLFAIQQHKPAPFYILDEADAALDAVNANKLGGLLKNYANISQFVIISHNDIVIRAVDQVIGVARGADGSSVVGLKLSGKDVQKPITDETIKIEE
ncbi:MAG: chromosome segregation protein SMC [Candidatus Diapherotrites archaeon]|nr:chromosome segregation protein SMC [Candidatus Diapherotrites archaeon]